MLGEPWVVSGGVRSSGLAVVVVGVGSAALCWKLLRIRWKGLCLRKKEKGKISFRAGSVAVVLLRRRVSFLHRLFFSLLPVACGEKEEMYQEADSCKPRILRCEGQRFVAVQEESSNVMGMTPLMWFLSTF